MLSDKQLDALVGQLFENIEFTAEPAGLYDPLRYMIKIGGKRLRPRLCLLTYSFFSDTFDDGILLPATGLEVFHSFTLIHDDIMDRSPMRRGVPTVWTKWNEDTAILSGDVMQTDAFRRIAKAPAKVLDRALDLFTKTAAEVCEGQQYDMDFESVPEVPMADYEKMIGLKTAVLLACSASMGAVIGGASRKDCEALYYYGYQLGMAFQIADDYLDAFGDAKVFGKPIGGDILNEKKSWLTVRALEKTSDKAGFLKAFTSKAETEDEKAAKIDTVRNMYVELGVDSDARAEVVRFSELAVEALKNSSLSSIKVETLRRFADNLVRRAK